MISSVNLKSSEIFKWFEEICKIPHGSGNEKALSDYIVRFAKERGLFVFQDSANNVIIKKDAYKGYENIAPVVLQGHMDMVCVSKDTVCDMTKEPIKLLYDKDFIFAEGTSLGADDGIAVAYMLALLDSKNIPHPKLECIITTDEEVGMGGAKALDMSIIEGRRLINIDSEEEGIFLVSCAGGIRASIKIPISKEKAPLDFTACKIKVSGLKGGHSGSDIHLQRASGIKLLGRVLNKLKESQDIRLSCVSGGFADNAIAADAEADVFLSDFSSAKGILKTLEKEFNIEYKSSEDGIYLKLEKVCPEISFTKECTEKIIKSLLLVPYGIKTMSLEIKELVESSCNPGVVLTTDKEFIIKCAVRSSLEIRKRLIVDEIKAIASLCGGYCEEKSDYPSWEYNPRSELMKFVPSLFEKMFGKKSEIQAIHAGLECGVFSGKIPDMDMISFGPDLFEVHSVNERLSICSAERMWEFLKEILKNIK